MSCLSLLRVLLLIQLVIWPNVSMAVDLQAEAHSRLVEQIRYGETIYRDDLVKDAAERLLRIDPESRQALLAQVYLFTRSSQMDQARQQLDKLLASGPDTLEYQQASALIELASEDSQRALAQARLFAAVGRVAEARVAYDAVFKGRFPTADLSLEYWQLRARDADSRELAIHELNKLVMLYPRHPGTLLALANYSFADGQPEQGLRHLNVLSKNTSQREVASSRAFEYLSTLPVTERSTTLWAEFVGRYSGTRLDSEAKTILANQRRLIGDPVWRGGRQGIVMTDKGEGQQALPKLLAAVKAYPTDPELLGALGLAYLRMGDRTRALKYFLLAKDNEPLIDATSRWTSLIGSTQYWMILEQASKAMERSDWSAAQRFYEKAHQQEPTNIFALVGLGDVALAEHHHERAWPFYLSAFKLEPKDLTTQRGLQRYLSTLEPEVALTKLSQFPVEQQRYLAELKRIFMIVELEGKALAAQELGDWKLSSQWLSQAQVLDLNDPWLSYRLGVSLKESGQTEQALLAYKRHLDLHPKDPLSVYPFGLLLESQDQLQQGMDALKIVPIKNWTSEMSALNERLQNRIIISQAQKLYNDGDVRGAIKLLEKSPGVTSIELLIAEWSLLDRQYEKALRIYQKVILRDPDNIDAQLGKLETWSAQGKTAMVKEQLLDHPLKIPAQEANAYRRLAMLWVAVGMREEAIAILKMVSKRDGPVSPLIYRDYARLSAEESPDFALQLYQKAMIGSGLLMPVASGKQLDDVSFTQALRTPDVPLDWLSSSIRSDAAALYQRTNPRLTVSTDDWFRNGGTPGLSALRANTTMTQIDYPVASGVGFFRADYIQMNAGSLPTNSTGSIDERFGTCIFNGQTATGKSVSLPGCQNVPSQSADGTSFAIGWEDSRWGFDIGHTPSSFLVSNWTGGINVQGDLGELGWRATASKRPMANSLLSLAGTTDPRTGEVWGGVMATGANIGLSWDKGLSDGVWANIGYHNITGTNVADNNRLRVMGGYYHRLINKPNELLTAGVNATAWSYERDLSNFTFGQGGYYSPQMYASLGLPVGYAKRWEDWAFMLQGSVSVSVARTNSESYYPLLGNMLGPVSELMLLGATPSSVTSSNTSAGGQSTGFGYSLRGAFERRINDHVVLGAAFDLQHTQDYAPSRVMVYMRYFFKSWAGDLQLRPSGLTPLVDFN